MFLPREEGQGLIEFVLIIALIAIVAIGALVMLAGEIIEFLNAIAAAARR
jgi:Flp pilus assembly pilin Flp